MISEKANIEQMTIHINMRFYWCQKSNYREINMVINLMPEKMISVGFFYVTIQVKNI